MISRSVLLLDSRLRGNDGVMKIRSFHKTITYNFIILKMKNCNKIPRGKPFRFGVGCFLRTSLW